MRIACLQFAPELGKPTENIIRANTLLEAASPQNLDLLVLPELAFSGYNHPSFPSIQPYLEPTSSGLSTHWARTTAAKHKCIVTVGYPELSTSPSPPTSNASSTSQPIAHNSTITVSPTGTIIAHYRKTHLYYTDETWAQPAPQGWLSTALLVAPKTARERTIKASFGICMDLNPHRFQAPWTDYEFASHALASGSELLILSMAWLTNLSRVAMKEGEEEADMDTLTYWIERLKPLVMGEKEVVVICANRCGEEAGKNPAQPLGEDGVRYAGSSWVGKVGGGEVKIWGIAGRGKEEVLVVDTEEEPRWSLRMTPMDGEADE